MSVDATTDVAEVVEETATEEKDGRGRKQSIDWAKDPSTQEKPLNDKSLKHDSPAIAAYFAYLQRVDDEEKDLAPAAMLKDVMFANEIEAHRFRAIYFDHRIEARTKAFQEKILGKLIAKRDISKQIIEKAAVIGDEKALRLAKVKAKMEKRKREEAELEAELLALTDDGLDLSTTLTEDELSMVETLISMEEE